MSEVGFVTMGKTAGDADVKPIGVGMLGYAFMGKAHSNGYKTMAYMAWPPPLMPQLVAIAAHLGARMRGLGGQYCGGCDGDEEQRRERGQCSVSG